MKSKKTLSISVLSTLFVGLSTSTFVLGLSSCASNPSNVPIPATNASSFSSINSSILPVSSAVFSTEKGRQSLVNTYITKTLQNWFNIVNNNSIKTSLKEWKKSSEDSYKEKYDNYKDTRGVNWKHFFQTEVLDPVGGTKEDWILDNIKSKLKSSITNSLFSDSAKNYLSYSSNLNSTNPTFTSVNNLNLQILKDIDNDFVNANTIGTKNGFQFNALGLEENNRSKIDSGYADLMEFIMDDWIKNCLPLPLTMSLWKNYENKYYLNQLFSKYFDRFNETTSDSNNDSGGNNGDSSGENSSTSPSSRLSSRASEGKFKPSYQFQYFESNDNQGPISLGTTNKFGNLLTGIINGSYISSKTGLMNLPIEYTEDSSTSLLTNSSGLFDGTYVTPFSAAAWYKLSNFVFGINDSNVHIAKKVNTKSIMDNFLVFNSKVDSTKHLNVENNQNNASGLNYFKFPYEIVWENGESQTTQSVFTNQYNNAIGIIDAINFDKNTTIFNDTNTYTNSNLDQFILIRNQFGVHIISIDRISKLKEAYNSNTTQSFSAKFKNVCNELRNTFIYYLALDLASNEKKYNVMDMLQKYFSNNFESIIYRYLLKYIDSPSTNENNLFGANVTLDSKETINLSSNFGFDPNNEDQLNFINSLNEVSSKSSLRSFIDSSINYQYAELSKKFVDSINTKIYENQSQFNNNENPISWGANGISGVLPYTRNGTNGNFETLTKLIDSILMNVDPANSNLPFNNGNNSKQISGTISNVTITDTLSYFYNAKNKYQQSVINYLNQTNPLIINGTYDFMSAPTRIFTNNYYLNQAMIALGDTDFTNIVRNMYYQQYLYPSRKLSQSNQVVGPEGSNSWIAKKVNDSIDSIYKVNNFVNQKNVYALGDWDSYDSFKQKAIEFFNRNMEENQFSYSYVDQNGNKNEYYSYSQYDKVTDYYNLLINIRYVIDYNLETNKFNFKPLYDSLLKATDNGTNLKSSRATIAWVNQESITEFNNFGYSSSNLSNTLSISDVQTKMNSDSKFKVNPVLLTNVNSYSWFNCKNPYADSTTISGSLVNQNNQNVLTFTKDNSYWTVSPMEKNKQNNSQNSGFIGFQLEDSSLGINSSLPSSWKNNNTYSNLPISQSSISYIGMFYSYGSRSNLIKLINDITTPFLLQDFYEKSIADSGLPISQENHSAIENIIKTQYGTVTERLNALKTKLKEVINDTVQVPENAFKKMEQMPLWNDKVNSFTTLFDTSSSTSALKNQYILTQFNNNDVKNMLNSNGELATGQNAYLGLNPDTFFNALVMFCRDSSTLKNDAIDEMYKTIGAIQVYDIRLLYVIPKLYISNFEQWSEVQKIS